VRARPTALALHGVVLVALIAGPLAYVTADKAVTLEVDGASRVVRTYSATVSGVLSEQGVRVGERDDVSPSPDTKVTNGLRVAVVRARPVSLVIDGVARETWTTAQTVGDLSRQLGARFESAYLSVSRDERIPLDGFSLTVRMPKSVTVRSMGRTTALVSTEATWADALAEAGFVLGPLDELSVPVDSTVQDGQAVVITRVSLRVVVRKVTVPFAVHQFSDASLYLGTSRVTQPGVPGHLTETWRYTLQDGKSIVAKLLSRSVLSVPVTETIARGTRPRPLVPPPSTSADDLNWWALARCESGGNPRAVGGGGLFFGLYQFSLGTWQGVGGLGNPIDSSSAEQTYRAELLYLRSGASNWPYCGHLLFT
jgi:resuscitation-promoting factor RpfB